MANTAGTPMASWPQASPHFIRSRTRSGAQVPSFWPVLTNVQPLQRLGSSPSQAVSQQTPSTQNLLRHMAAAVQGAPLARLVVGLSTGRSTGTSGATGTSAGV